MPQLLIERVQLLDPLNLLHPGIHRTQFALSQCLAAALGFLAEQHADFFGSTLR